MKRKEAIQRIKNGIAEGKTKGVWGGASLSMTQVKRYGIEKFSD